jgi:hypothetical protein
MGTDTKNNFAVEGQQQFTALDNVLQGSGSPFYEAPGPEKFIQEARRHGRYPVPKVSLCK